MPKYITISYDLHPPAALSSATSLQTAKVYEFSVASKSNQQEFYSSLRDAVAAAKSQIGADLTAWRDAVGTLENTMEPKKKKNGEVIEDEDEDEEDENEE
ncbi:hypothetical protein M0805_003284 [Coniferiporia weirii]|nr:hypothetical protein M0805_003284 [Coniferiporia weirii]